MTETLTQAADRLFRVGDRIRLGSDMGTVKAVNVHKAAVVSVQLDGAYTLTPALFTDLFNLSAARRDSAARTASGTSTYQGEIWDAGNLDNYAG